MKVWLVRYQTIDDRWSNLWFATKRDASQWRTECQGNERVKTALEPKPVPVPRNGAAVAALLNRYGDTDNE